MVDLGVAADFVGNLFAMVLPKLSRATEKERCNQLFRMIRAYYTEHKVESRLDRLTPTMIAQPGKSPKLRAHAAETRGLIKFAKFAAEQYMDPSNPHENAVLHAARSLCLMYEQLSSQAPFSGDLLAEHSKRFCLLYCALEKALGADGKHFRVKPKLHMLQELAEMTLPSHGVKPSTFWTYRDEDFGGSLAAMHRRRGGPVKPRSVAAAVLLKFCAGNRLPCIVPGGML